jgi:acetyl-CoA carboxylase carboxyltransferase component
MWEAGYDGSVAAERGYIGDVIMPSQTRRRIARALAMLRGKRVAGPGRKHDNLPLCAFRAFRGRHLKHNDCRCKP